MLSLRRRYGKYLVLVVLFISCSFSENVFSQEVMMYGVEDNEQGGGVPFWSCEQVEYCTGEVNVSKRVSREGNYCLEMIVDFPGNRWTAGIVEVEGNFDLSESKYIIFDIFIPYTAPRRLETKVILAIEDHSWLEMNKTYTLTPGKWTRVKASMKKTVNGGPIEETLS